MTLKDLLDTNSDVTELNFIIRENGRFIKEWRIGKYAECSEMARTGGAGQKLDIEVITKSMNKRDKSDYWQTILTAVPKKLLELEVHHWYARHDHNYESAAICDATVLYVTHELSVERAVAPVEEKKSDQLEGQMSIEEFLEAENEKSVRRFE